jgi:hypothetical protein
MSRRTRLVMEISVLIVAGCAAGLLVQTPVPDNLHLVPYGAKWLVYQGSSSLFAFVLPPLLVVLAIGAFWTRLISGKRNYWIVWRAATIAAACFLVLATEANRYGQCRDAHSVSYCRRI